MRFLPLVWLLSACASAGPTVYVVRHAEKALDQGEDPPLTPAGALRAQSLAQTLRSTPFEAIYSTRYLRNQATAAVIAEQQRCKPIIAAPEALLPLLRQHRGNVLVVGHSNTVPELVRALGDLTVTLSDSDYDDLFILRDGRALRLHYGPPNPQN